MSSIRTIAMMAFIAAGAFLLILGPLDDRSLNWVNIALAGACFFSAILLRRRKSSLE